MSMNPEFNIPAEENEILLKAFPKGIVVMDVETTGLSPLVDRIIELSAIKITPEGVFTFSELLDPKIKIPEETIAIHNITDDMVKGKPTIEDILPNFLDFCKGHVLAAHNAKFDIGYLTIALHKCELELISLDIYCSMLLARACFPECKSYKLGALCEQLKIVHENAHRALDDAYAALRVMGQSLLRRCDDKVLENARQGNLLDYEKAGSEKLPLKYEQLYDWTQERRIIEMVYSGGSHKGVFRPVVATSLLPLPQGTVLYGHCLLTDLYKTFKLTKIREYRLAEGEEFERYQKILEKFHKAKES